MAKLTARQAQTLGEGNHGDGGNLYLRVKPSGARSWVFRYKAAGKAKEIGMGSLDTRSLADARTLAADMRKAIANGTEPALLVRPAKESPKLTFEEVAKEHIAAMTPQWRNAKHVWQWSRSLEMYVYPVIGKLAPDTITTDHVLRVLSPIWAARTTTASRLRQRIEAILDRAGVLGLRDRAQINPATWDRHLAILLAAPSKVRHVVHHAACSYSELSGLLAQLREVETVGSLALQFVVLTAVRSGEATGATWGEVNMDARTWTIPESRMKAEKEHAVPLSGPALVLLEKMAAMRTGSTYIFPSPVKPRQPIGGLALLKALRQILPGASVHGMRSAFRDWASEQSGAGHEAIELSLAHTVGSDTERSYRRTDLLTQRRALMDAWACFLSEKAA